MNLVVGGAFQGKEEWTEKNFSGVYIWKEFHKFIKSELESGKSEKEINDAVEERLCQNPDTVVLCDELGCGVVPFNPEDRIYRELTGRLLCKIAEKSDSVYRIVCGIGQRIK